MAQPQQPRYPTLPGQQGIPQYYTPTPPPRLPSPSGVQLPPNKRPRLSPNPPSPHVQSPYGGSPYLSPGHAQPPPFHAPQPIQSQPSDAMANAFSRPVMGPPARPDKDKDKQKEKGTNVEDLSDVLALAGVDVKDEESALTQYNLHGSQSFSSSTVTPSNSFGSYPYGQLPSGAGPFSQPTQSEVSVEQEVYRKHKDAARALAENNAKVLNNPFLQANAVRNRVQSKVWENNVKVNVEGLFDPIKRDTLKPTATAVVNADQSAGIVSVQPSLLEENSSFAEILSLLSLAANERIRSLVEDAFRLSRGRQVSAQGVVTPGFEDLAVGNGVSKPSTILPQNITGTAWEDVPQSAISPMTVVPHKRLAAEDTGPSNLPTPPTEPASSPKRPVPSISFPNVTAQAIRSLASSEREFEKQRLAQRAKRQRAAAVAADKADDTTPMEDVKPAEPKLTKKERERIAKQGQTEEVLQRQANATARMALGKSRYSWMNAAAASASGGGIGTGAGVGKLGGVATGSRTPTATQSTGAGGAVSAVAGPDKNLIARDRRFGDWREDDGRDAKKIVIRDWIAVLERDGIEKKALAKAIARLGQPYVMKTMGSSSAAMIQQAPPVSQAPVPSSAAATPVATGPTTPSTASGPAATS